MRGVSAAFCFSVMLWPCVFLLIFTSPRSIDAHPSRARVFAGFPQTDLFAKRALFDGASPDSCVNAGASLTSLVIRTNGAVKGVSRAFVVAGACSLQVWSGSALGCRTPRLRSWELPAVRVLTAYADRYNSSFQLRRVIRKSKFTVSGLSERSGRLENLEASATFGTGCYVVTRHSWQLDEMRRIVNAMMESFQRLGKSSCKRIGCIGNLNVLE